MMIFRCDRCFAVDDKPDALAESYGVFHLTVCESCRDEIKSFATRTVSRPNGVLAEAAPVQPPADEAKGWEIVWWHGKDGNASYIRRKNDGAWVSLTSEDLVDRSNHMEFLGGTYDTKAFFRRIVAAIQTRKPKPVEVAGGWIDAKPTEEGFYPVRVKSTAHESGWHSPLVVQLWAVDAGDFHVRNCAGFSGLLSIVKDWQFGPRIQFPGDVPVAKAEPDYIVEADKKVEASDELTAAYQQVALLEATIESVLSVETQKNAQWLGTYQMLSEVIGLCFRPNITPWREPDPDKKVEPDHSADVGKKVEPEPKSFTREQIATLADFADRLAERPLLPGHSLMTICRVTADAYHRDTQAILDAYRSSKKVVPDHPAAPGKPIEPITDSEIVSLRKLLALAGPIPATEGYQLVAFTDKHYAAWLEIIAAHESAKVAQAPWKDKRKSVCNWSLARWLLRKAL